MKKIFAKLIEIYKDPTQCPRGHQRPPDNVGYSDMCIRNIDKFSFMAGSE